MDVNEGRGRRETFQPRMLVHVCGGFLESGPMSRDFPQRGVAHLGGPGEEGVSAGKLVPQRGLPGLGSERKLKMKGRKGKGVGVLG